MNLTREHFWSGIYYNFRCALTQQQRFNTLRLLFLNEIPFLVTICNWFNEFNNGRSNLNDDPHEDVL